MSMVKMSKTDGETGQINASVTNNVGGPWVLRPKVIWERGDADMELSLTDTGDSDTACCEDIWPSLKRELVQCIPVPISVPAGGWWSLFRCFGFCVWHFLLRVSSTESDSTVSTELTCCGVWQWVDCGDISAAWRFGTGKLSQSLLHNWSGRDDNDETDDPPSDTSAKAEYSDGTRETADADRMRTCSSAISASAGCTFKTHH